MPTLAPPITAFTQADLLAVLDRLLPLHYLDGLKSPGPGYELLQGFAAIMARVSQANAALGTGAFILSSTGGVLATGSVELYRPTANVEGISVTVKAGTVLSSSKGGRTYVTTADVTFAAADLGPFLVPIAAAEFGGEYNEPGMGVALNGDALQGEIDTIDTLVESPDAGDLTIRVRHPIATSGGVDAFLDAHGKDRGIARGAGESDTAYRNRITTIPDNISPNAFDRALQQLLLPYGLTYQFIETWSAAYQTCFDCPAVAPAGSALDPTLFCYDDPRTAVTSFRNRWLDTNDYRGGVVVVIPLFGPLSDVGMAFDDTATNALALSNTYGNRAVGAYDVVSTVTAVGERQGCFDGYDLGSAVLSKTVYDTMQRIKAAGISVAVELRGQ